MDVTILSYLALFAPIIFSLAAYTIVIARPDMIRGVHLQNLHRHIAWKHAQGSSDGVVIFSVAIFHRWFSSAKVSTTTLVRRMPLR